MNSAAIREARQHLTKLCCGSPLLVRTNEQEGQGDLQICICSVDEELESLVWVEKEGAGRQRQAPIANIVDLKEEPSIQGLILTLKNGPSEADLSQMTLICATAEDLVPWREGLLFLVGMQRLGMMGLPHAPTSASVPAPKATKVPIIRHQPPSPSPSPSASKAKSSAPTTRASPGAAAAAAAAAAKAAAAAASLPSPSAAAAVAAAKAKSPTGPSSSISASDVGRLLEANDELRHENQNLREIMKRKDETIADLKKQLQSQERGSKTMDTTRESEKHLHDRDVAILQRQNRRLRRALGKKQETISELLKMVGRVTQQQGFESSAVEDGGLQDEDEDDDDDEEEVEEELAEPSVASVRGALQVGGRAASSKAAAPAAPARRLAAEQKELERKAAAAAPPKAKAAEEEMDLGDSSEAEDLKAEMQELVGQLAKLEKDVESSINFAPPPRGGAASAAAGAAGSSGAASMLASILGGGSSSSGGAPPGAPAQLLQALMSGLGGGGQAPPRPPTAPAPAVTRPPPVAPPASKAGPASAGASVGAAKAMSSPAAAAASSTDVPPRKVEQSPDSDDDDDLAEAAGKGSTYALKVLERELAALEEKKRIVERLARTSVDKQPGSSGAGGGGDADDEEDEDEDDDEDDGFPLR